MQTNCEVFLRVWKHRKIYDELETTITAVAVYYDCSVLLHLSDIFFRKIAYKVTGFYMKILYILHYKQFFLSLISLPLFAHYILSFPVFLPPLCSVVFPGPPLKPPFFQSYGLLYSFLVFIHIYSSLDFLLDRV